MSSDLHQHYSTNVRQNLQISAVWLCILVFISFLSFQLRNFTDSLLLYLPTAFSILLIHWYGYRILPIIYINAIITLVMWNAKGGMFRVLLIATHEPLVAFISKVLVDKFQRKTANGYFSSANQVVSFTLLGIVVPIIFNSLYTYHYSFINGDLRQVSLLLLSDFITIFCVSLPMLYFFYPGQNGGISLIRPIRLSSGEGYPWIEFWGVIITFVVLSFFVPFGQYWFIYGIVTVLIGVRQGFEAVLLINAILFFVNYILPLVESSTALITSAGSTQLTNVHLGNATMLFISTLVGKVVSDLRATEQTLIRQKQEIEKTNQQLYQTNQELDRFAYSVSHDLSAPLKSIQGLIHISRMETKESQSLAYLDMMEKSALRLNDFINEVLDYSRTSRKEIDRQQIRLSDLMDELKEKFILQDEGKIQFKLSLESASVFTDATLLKIVLGNLLSNAIKFQKKTPDHKPEVTIISFESQDEIHIEVKDNGEGIPAIHIEKVFDMFYRATSRSPGSGLGLYIAREAIHKLGGRITVQTIYGEGSVFSIHLPIK